MNMETDFYITLSLKTISGYESFGKFFIGNDPDFAYALFDKLKGSQEVDDAHVLHLDFVETREDLPVNIRMISCTLADLGENCRIITREVFKFLNLEEL
jgi:hypothetical protein